MRMDTYTYAHTHTVTRTYTHTIHTSPVVPSSCHAPASMPLVIRSMLATRAPTLTCTSISVLCAAAARNTPEAMACIPPTPWYTGVLEGRPKKSCGSWPGLVGASPSTCSNRPFHSMACFPLSHSGRMHVRNSAVSARKNWQPWSHAKDEVAVSSAAMGAPSSARIRRTDVRPPSALPWSKSTIVEPDGRRRTSCETAVAPVTPPPTTATFTALVDMGYVLIRFRSNLPDPRHSANSVK